MKDWWLVTGGWLLVREERRRGAPPIRIHPLPATLCPLPSH